MNLLNDVKNRVVTSNAMDVLESKHGGWVYSTEHVRRLMEKFSSGDFGDIPQEDIETNQQIIKDKGMVMGVYPLDPREPAADKVWIILDPGHETVTVLLPEDY